MYSDRTETRRDPDVTFYSRALISELTLGLSPQVTPAFTHCFIKPYSRCLQNEEKMTGVHTHTYTPEIKAVLLIFEMISVSVFIFLWLSFVFYICIVNMSPMVRVVCVVCVVRCGFCHLVCCQCFYVVCFVVMLPFSWPGFTCKRDYCLKVTTLVKERKNK